MKKNLKNRIILVVAVLAICVFGIFGKPSGVTGKDLGEAVTKRIHLGLDLRGGAHLILQVKVEEAVNADTDNAVARIKQDLKTANLSFSQAYKPDPAKPTLIRVEGVTPAKANDAHSLLDSKYSSEYDLADGDTSGSFTLTMKPMVEKALEKKTDEQAIEAIRDRVDALGVSEPQIQEYGLGDNQILVDLPGVENESQIESIIQGTNRLEIHAVVGGPYKDAQEATASTGGSIPPDEELKSFSGVMEGGASADSVYVLQRASVVAGNDFRSADPGINSNTGQREVDFTLTNEAGDKFYDYTSKNVGKAMAVVMNDHIREVANIKSAIRDRGEIEGSFSPDEVAALSKLLRTGALPASLEQLEKRFVGASLGKDSIDKGVTAAIVGILVVMAFMLIYYRGSGINAGGADSEPDYSAGLHGGVFGHFDLARHRRSDSDYRHGRGLECADLRAHPRRGAGWQGSVGGCRSGLCSCLDHHRRYARDNDCLGGHPLCLWQQSGEGIRDHADRRIASQPVYRGLCLAVDL